MNFKPQTAYAIQVAAVGTAGTGPKSTILHVKTGRPDE
ncbi:fibronectin type III domain-containing protein [Streptomyces sp. NPDC059650]